MNDSTTSVRIVHLQDLKVQRYDRFKRATLVTAKGSVLAQVDTVPQETLVHLQFRLMETALKQRQPQDAGDSAFGIWHRGTLTVHTGTQLEDFALPDASAARVTIEAGQVANRGQELQKRTSGAEDLLRQEPAL